MNPDRFNGLFENSKDDRFILVGSDVREIIQAYRDACSEAERDQRNAAASQAESVKLLDENRILRDKLGASDTLRAAHAKEFQKTLTWVRTLVEIVRDYPKGQDDGRWIKRREEALKIINGDFENFPDYPEEEN